MSILDWFSSDSSSIQDLTLEDVEQERRRLNIKEGKALRKLEEEEAEREEIFRKGANVTSKLRRRQLARKYKRKKHTIQRLEQKLNRVSKQLLTLSAIRLVLQRRKQMKEGVSGLLQEVSEQQIRELLEDDKISYDLYMDKLDNLLEETSVPTDDELFEQLGSEGQEVIEAWEAMDEGDIEEMDEAMEEAEEKMKERRDLEPPLTDEQSV